MDINLLSTSRVEVLPGSTLTAVDLEEGAAVSIWLRGL